jgi:hypothetical protein
VLEISEAIEKLAVKDQLELLRVLPLHLKIPPEDLGWSRLTEPAFESGIIPRMPFTIRYKRGDILPDLALCLSRHWPMFNPVTTLVLKAALVAGPAISSRRFSIDKYSVFTQGRCSPIQGMVISRPPFGMGDVVMAPPGQRTWRD